MEEYFLNTLGPAFVWVAVAVFYAFMAWAVAMPFYILYRIVAGIRRGMRDRIR